MDEDIADDGTQSLIVLMVISPCELRFTERSKLLLADGRQGRHLFQLHFVYAVSSAPTLVVWSLG